jgi:DNA-binding transcriptional regulator PaaX
LVKLLAPLGIAAPAVRTAVSRMVRQGWLAPRRLATGPGYALTAKAVKRLDEAASRIYRTAKPSWNGRFDLIVLDPPLSRPARARLNANLAFLGYGNIGDRTWVAPRASEEADLLLAEAGVRYDRFARTRQAASDSGAVADEVVVQVAEPDLVAVPGQYCGVHVLLEHPRPVHGPVRLEVHTHRPARSTTINLSPSTRRTA